MFEGAISLAGITIPHVYVVGGGVAITVIGTVALIVAGLLKRSKSTDKDIFEHQDIEKLLKPDISEMIIYWGSDADVKLRYRYDVKGKVVKQLDYRSDIISKSDSGKTQDLNIDEDQLEDDYDGGRISERVYKTIKEFESEPVHILLVRPVGFINKLQFKLDQIVGSSNLGRIKIIPDRLIRDDVDYMTIKNSAEFTRFAGMDVAIEASAFNFIENIGFKNLYSQSLQDQQNYHKQVNFYSSRFSQELQKLERRAEVEGQKYRGKKADIVNED